MFQPELTGVLEGAISVDVTEPGLAPKNIIADNVPFSINVTWNFSGALIAMTFPGSSNQFEVRAYVESIGPPAFEDQVGATQTVDWSALTVNPGPPPYYQWSANVPVAAGDLAPGLYRLSVIITSIDAGGNPVETTGFEEYPLLQIFTPAP